MSVGVGPYDPCPCGSGEKFKFCCARKSKIGISPAQPTVEENYQHALAHHQAGRLVQAEKLYRQILAQRPNHADALHLLGVICAQTRRFDDAVELIGRAVAINPNLPEAHNNLANAWKEKGKLGDAIAGYRRAIALRPGYAEAHNNLGNALKEDGQFDPAVAACRQAIALNPRYAEAFYNLGNALKEKGQLDDAVAAYRQAIALRPNFPEAYNNLGNALQGNGKPNDAIAAFHQAIAQRPNFDETFNNLGNALKDNGQLDAAIAAFHRAIALNPDSPEAHSNLAVALKDTGQVDQAITAYRRAVAIDPDNARIEGGLIYTLYFHPGYDSQAIAMEQRRWNSRHAAPLTAAHAGRTCGGDRNPERRLRIGYVSPDFKEHVVGRNLLPLFRRHDHGQFEVICYAQVLRPDSVTAQFQQNADGWRSTVGLSDERVAEQIRADRIDILVDLTLHMANSRLLVFARRPAPVQVTYLGYCGSTGMSAMDYRLSDPHLDPPGADVSCYSEKTIRLPQTYWCYQPGTAPTPDPAPPPAAGNGFVTFGCLNNFAKVSTAALELWARILVAVPNSRIIIYAPPGRHLSDVAQRMADAGVAKDRLSFVGQQGWTEYAQTYSRIDIALDPFPYGGGITTCDALWMGVPVVTLSGQTAVGRGGRSILSNLGLTELIAFTPDQYAQIAVDLAGDVNRMADLRRSMRTRMLASPLMDAGRFACDVEAVYRQMWRTWCQTGSSREKQET